MRYRYIGKDKSLGYRTGEVYDLLVREEGRYVLVLSPYHCPYQSWKTFYDNWQRVVDIPAQVG